jgi:hypothetical protein
MRTEQTDVITEANCSYVPCLSIFIKLNVTRMSEITNAYKIAVVGVD